MTSHILIGDCLQTLPRLPERSVHCCVTSPPYFGLRSYLPGDHPQKAHEIGTEATPEEYVARLVAVFREVRRVLRDDGTLWLNLGDSYARNPAKGTTGTPNGRNSAKMGYSGGARIPRGTKEKDLIGIPWMVAFALRADGWYLRQENIWAKRNCMPESIKDRTTRAHETVFMLAKRPRYFYDAFAIEEDGDIPAGTRAAKGSNVRGDIKDVNGRPPEYWDYDGRRNKRSVWWEVTMPFADAHFATMTPPIAEICIRAGTSEHGCCCTCGVPYQRILSRRKPTGARGNGNKERVVAANGEQNRTNTHVGTGAPYVPTTRTTIGWHKPCSCPDLHPRSRCVVLDPFGGAGTTAMVADREGRDSIYCDISADFASIAKKRLTKDGGLFSNIVTT